MPPKTNSSDSSSATRLTRSQVAPNWTHTQTLILVNEIAAVESDCLDALSCYQKWKIIADNCAALDVNRTLDQCRRKWDCLFSDYNAIKSWEADNKDGGLSYWGFGRERRRENGLPEEFERELFDAVDDVVKAQVERASLRPDVVMEDADADPLGVIAPPVLRKRSYQFTPQKLQNEVKPNKRTEDDKGTGSVGVMASQMEENAGSMDITAPKVAKKAGTVKVAATQTKEKTDSAELWKNAEMIQAILEGKLAENNDYSLSDLRKGAKGPASRINLARRQGDKLIDCFSVIANTLDQLCNVAHTK